MTGVGRPRETGKPGEETTTAALIAAEAALDERTPQGRHLTAGERAARQRALDDARRDEDVRRAIEAEAAHRAAALAAAAAAEDARRRELGLEELPAAPAHAPHPPQAHPAPPHPAQD